MTWLRQNLAAIALFLAAITLGLGGYNLSHEQHQTCTAVGNLRTAFRTFIHKEVRVTPNLTPAQQAQVRQVLKDTDQSFSTPKC